MQSNPSKPVMNPIGPLSAALRKTAATSTIPVLLLLALCSAIPSLAENASGRGTKPAHDPVGLDSAIVHKYYIDGEFEPAIEILEQVLRTKGRYTHGDSVFIFKHLGVMYAAQYETREKGKYYMHRLLEVEPSAKIMDMYASDMIYMIFKNIQEEYAQNQMMARKLSEPAPGDGQRQASEAGKNGSDRTGETSGRAKWIWAGAAAVTVAAGVGIYLMLPDEKSPQVHAIGD